jgi:hypothetical protein
MRRFHLVRHEDVTNISGTGVVAEGCVYSRGKVVVVWLTSVPSIVVYDDLASVEAIHGHGGKTEVRFLDPDPGQSWPEAVA